MGGVVLDDLTAAMDAAGDADPAQLADCESVLALVRLQKRLASVVAKAAAACADAGEWRGGGGPPAAPAGRPAGGRGGGVGAARTPTGPPVGAEPYATCPP